MKLTCMIFRLPFSQHFLKRDWEKARLNWQKEQPARLWARTQAEISSMALNNISFEAQSPEDLISQPYKMHFFMYWRKNML